MANTKSKKTTKKSSSKSKTVKTVKASETKKVEETKVIASTASNKKLFAGFFARKYDENENILTIFKTPKIWGSLIGEMIGTMLLAAFILSLNWLSGQTGLGATYMLFGMVAIIIGVYAFSGAHLNPLVTVGMMASRRISAIRGILYIVAQVVGAWLGLMLISAFKSAGGEAASAVELPAMAELTGDHFWTTTLVEFMGAGIIGFFFARALQYKRSVFTFAIVVACGVSIAMILGLIIMNVFFSTTNGFMMNPAVAIMYQIFPSSGENFGELFGNIALAAVTYIIFPMIGGALGFYLSDFAGRLSGEEAK